MRLKPNLAEITSSITQADPDAHRTGAVTLGLFLFFWIAFSIAHLLCTRGCLASDQWLISKDGGYAEYFEYALLLFSSGAFLTLFIRQRQFLYLVISAILFYITVDNALELHERAGRHYEAAGLTSPIPHVRPSHLGEFLYLSGIGATLLGMLFLTVHKAEPDARNIGWVIVILIICIGMFSAVIDTVSDWLVSSQLAYLEDSGELFFIALIASYSVFLTVQHSTKPTTNKR